MYDDYEGSGADGQPFFMYQFARGAATPTYLAALPSNKVYDGITWTASEVRHEVLEQSGNVERNELELTFSISDTFAFGLLIPQFEITTVTVFRAHLNDPAQERRQYWKGRIVGATTTAEEIKVRTENVFTSLRRPGCRVRVQRPCRHDLYGIECGADKNDFDHGVVVTAIAGLMLTIPAAASYAARTFEAGMILWNNIYGTVDYHSGTSVRLVTELPGLEEALAGGSQSAVLYDGCDRSLTGTRGCVHFNNVLNYGGFRWIPKLNPFTNRIV